jgi:hypothetical protein
VGGDTVIKHPVNDVELTFVSEDGYGDIDDYLGQITIGKLNLVAGTPHFYVRCKGTFSFEKIGALTELVKRVEKLAREINK